MPLPVISEGKSGQTVWDRNGRRTSRNFSVVAASADLAIAALAADPWNVYRGAVYETPQGDVPDSWCICRDITATPRVEGNTHGDGHYYVAAHYYYLTDSVERPALPYGPPKIWTERSLMAVPADIDTVGNVICNAAGQPPSNPAVRYVVHRIVCIQWVGFFNDHWDVERHLAPCEGCINSTYFSMFEPHSLLCQTFDIVDPELPRAAGQFTTPFRITARLEYAPPKPCRSSGGLMTTVGGWDLVFPNRGAMVRKSDGTLTAADPNNPGQERNLSLDGTSVISENFPANHRWYSQMQPQCNFALYIPTNYSGGLSNPA